MQHIYGKSHEPHDQQAVMDGIVTFIEAFRGSHAYGPSYQEIGASVGLRSKSDVHRYVHMLRGRGLVQWDEGVHRTIRLTEGASL